MAVGATYAKAKIGQLAIDGLTDLGLGARPLS